MAPTDRERPRVVPGIPRADRQSRDNVELVLEQERNAKREGELLAQMASERQAHERELAELERRTQAPPLRVESSVPPKEGALDIRARITPQQLVTMIVALGALVGTVVNFARSEPKAPQIVDSSGPIREITAELSKQAQRLQALARHARASEDWTAGAFEAACVGVTRPRDSRELPGARVSSAPNLKRKCPAVRLENEQPVLPGRLDEAVPAPAALP